MHECQVLSAAARDSIARALLKSKSQDSSFGEHGLSFGRVFEGFHLEMQGKCSAKHQPLI